MSIQSYYRRALVLPLLLPAFTLPLAWTEVRLSEGPTVVMFLLYWSLLIGGIPYVLFAVGFALWSRGRSDREVRRGILLSPLFHAMVLMICAAGFLALDSSVFWNNVDDVGTLGAIAVLFGYAYVLLAELGRVLLRPARSAPAPQPAG